MKDRTGQRVKLNHNPDLIYEVTTWNEARELWRAKCVVPNSTLVEMEFRDDFLAYLDEHESEANANQ